MKRLRYLIIIACAFVVVACVTSTGKNTSRINYCGWEDSWKLQNEQVEMVVVPAVARVMHFGLKGRHNLFWTNPKLSGKPSKDINNWQNFGAAKLWLAPQSQWKQRWGLWPPHHEHDAGACKATFDSKNNSLSLQGMVSKKSGVRLDRTVRLLPNTPTAHMVYTMTNISEKPVSWSIWSVAQMQANIGRGAVPIDGKVWSEYNPTPKVEDSKKVKVDGIPQLPKTWDQYKNICVFKNNKDGGKVFTYSKPGWIVYENNGSAFLILYKIDEKAKYPEGDAPTEVCMSNGFVELEHVGPQVTIEPGKSTKLEEYWICLKVPTGMDDAKFAEWANAAAKSNHKEIFSK